MEELKCDCNSRALRNFTPLHIAAYHDHLDIVQYLVNKIGVDMLCRDILGLTPLHCAAMNNSFKVAKFLVNIFPLSLLTTTHRYWNDTPLHIGLGLLLL